MHDEATASGLTTHPWPCCERPQPRIHKERLLRVEPHEGGLHLIFLTEYCRSCRAVISPQIAARITEAQRNEDDRTATLKQEALTLVGQSGSASVLGLPSWEELHHFTYPPHVPHSTLFEEHTAYRGDALRSELRRLLGLTNRRKRHALGVSVAGGAEVYIDHTTVAHMLDPRFQHRQTTDHLAYAPLIPTTIASPLEIWECPAFEGQSQPSLRFLATYRVGGEFRNHIAIVAKHTGWVVTGYAMNLRKATSRREGKLIAIGWAAP